MATFKALIRPAEIKNDGTWNVKIRVIHNRKTKYIPTPFFVSKTQITKSYKIKDAAILDKVEEQIRVYRNRITELGFQISDMNMEELIYALSYQEQRIDFIAFMKEYVEKLLKEGRIASAKKISATISSLSNFNKNRPLYFEDITANYMYKYYESLSSLKESSQKNYICTIKTIYKRAQLQFNDYDHGITPVRDNVFKRIELPKVNTERESLSVEQMQAIINLPYTGSFIYDFAKDMFVLSFVCFGINPQDLFFAKKDQYKDGILTYRRHKVQRILGKGAEMQIKMSNVAKKILDKYSNDKVYLIDFKGKTRSINICRYIHNSFISAGLEEANGRKAKHGQIRGKYVFYTARHTMATLARNVCEVDYITVHEMLNHAMPSNFRTTDVYIKRDFTRLWEANDKLLALFDWSFYLNQ